MMAKNTKYLKVLWKDITYCISNFMILRDLENESNSKFQFALYSFVSKGIRGQGTNQSQS